MKKLMNKVKRPKDGENRSGTQEAGSAAPAAAPLVPPQGDNTEAIVVREVIAFCESGAPGSNSAGEEYLHLPAIVDGAESSPSAAKEAAITIRRYLSKEHYTRGFAQYNAIMLMRILTDNPGKHFTQNVDKEFVSTVKRLLRDSPDQGVQQIIRETLDYFEAEKAPNNSTLGPLMEMWRKEKGLGAQLYARNNAGQGRSRGSGALASTNSRRSRTLPPPDELASRIEEAKTTARLLLQTMQSTPSADLSDNDLVKEFAARARAAQKSIQSYLHSTDPMPDDDTMLTLIETNEQLNIAMSKHHRALLSAKKQSGQATSPPPQSETPNYLGAYGQTSIQPRTNGSGQPANESSFVPPPGPPPSQQTGNRDAPDNPFTDDAEYDQDEMRPKNTFSLFGKSDNATTTVGETSYKPYNSSTTAAPVSSTTNSTTRPNVAGNGDPTQSYLNRQESATNNVTMHGASPPPPTQNQ